MRVCAKHGCPNLYPKTEGPHCPTHRAEYEHRRGSRQQRGYNTAHDRERRRWAPVVAQGRTPCAKCGQPISQGQAWDLGHTDDRTTWTGPEHATCNRSDGGTKSHQGRQ